MKTTKNIQTANAGDTLFADTVDALNAKAARFVQFIEENDLQPTTSAADTKNQAVQGTVKQCSRNNFNGFKPSGVKYQLVETGLVFECVKSYKYVTSGKNTVFFGTLTYCGVAAAVEGWTSDYFTELRGVLGLPVPDSIKGFDTLKDENDIPAYVEAEKVAFGAVLVKFASRYGWDITDEERATIVAKVATTRQNDALAHFAKVKAQADAKAQERAQKVQRAELAKAVKMGTISADKWAQIQEILNA